MHKISYLTVIGWLSFILIIAFLVESILGNGTKIKEQEIKIQSLQLEIANLQRPSILEYQDPDIQQMKLIETLAQNLQSPNGTIHYKTGDIELNVEFSYMGKGQ